MYVKYEFLWTELSSWLDKIKEKKWVENFICGAAMVIKIVKNTKKIFSCKKWVCHLKNIKKIKVGVILTCERSYDTFD